MVLNSERLIERMLVVMAEHVRRQARLNLLTMSSDSRQAKALRDDLKISVVADEHEGLGEVFTEYYWALYYHDGRGSIRARPGKFLVFFRDPDDDPRISGTARDYPRRAAENRRLRLSKAEFRSLLKSKRLIATKRVGPASAHPFFERGYARLQSKFGPTLVRLLSEEFLKDLRQHDVLDDRDVATFEL